MKRCSMSLRGAVAVAAIVVVMVQVAEAQRGERRGRPGGGPGGPGRGMPATAVRLAAESEEVQEALKLSDEQKEKVRQTHEELRKEAREMFRGERGGLRDMRGQMEKLLSDATSELMEVLNDEQQKKLAGIVIRANGAGAINDPLLAAELNLTDEQKEKLADIRDSQMQAMREQFRGERPSREEMRELRSKLEERRAEAQKEFLAVLTSEQQKQFEALKSEAPDIDISALRGPGRPGDFEGRGGDRERGRERDRPRRDRGERRSGEPSESN